MGFWDDWALWAKMIFVLGIGIVLTVIAGVLKLMYDQYQLRKFTRIEKEKSEAQPMVEEFARQKRGRQNDTPFGIRAIESGIEVEGVWISKNNSPASSAPVSPMLSPENVKGKGIAKGSDIPTRQIPVLQIPDQIHPYHERPLSSNSSIGSFEKATSAEKLDSGSITSDHIPIARSTYQPRQPSALRYSTADDMEAGRIPLRAGSGSSQGSSEGSYSDAQQQQHPSRYQQVREPNYYRPSVPQYHSNAPSIPPLARTSPEFGPGRSERSSFAAEGYTYGIPEKALPPPPTRYHYSGETQNSATDSFVNAYTPSNRSYADSRSSQVVSIPEAIELTDNPALGTIPAEKTKRITRKLQKKPPVL